ncbi:hypothetical protein RA265_29615, partial [Pseudomonas syringae pv. tagetis]|uniref:hypothetical protein n=1 Tax=Pseudomonas syringae group genomosp. 7 TaxID=251699 RepID=UPI00376F94D1
PVASSPQKALWGLHVWLLLKAQVAQIVRSSSPVPLTCVIDPMGNTCFLLSMCFLNCPVSLLNFYGGGDGLYISRCC